MKQIRHKVFETNSSSSHSLVMESKQVIPALLSKEQLREGVVSVGVDDYGWEYRRLYKPLSKASYLLTALTESIKEDTASVCDDHPQAQMLVDAFANRYGVKLEFANSSGYIDHQSTERGVGLELFASQEKLESFLFDESQYIQLGNDNSPAPWSMPTDKGKDELTYGHLMKRLPKGYEDIEVRIPDVVTPIKGVPVTVFEACGKQLSMELDLNREWLKELFDKGFVKRLEATRCASYSWDTSKGDAMSAFLDALYDKDHPLKPTLAKSVLVSASSRAPSGKHKNYAVDIALTLALPPELAQSFKAVPKTPAKELQLALAKEDLIICDRWLSIASGSGSAEKEKADVLKARAAYDKALQATLKKARTKRA